MQKLLVLAAVALLAIRPAACEGNATLDKHFVVARPGESCKSTCTSVGKKDAYFQPFIRPPQPANATSLCAVEVDGEGWVAGYSMRDGSPECEVVLNGTSYVDDEYACLCLEAQQTQGLVRADGGNCTNACSNMLSSLSTASRQEYGSIARSVAPDTTMASYACVPYDPTGAIQSLLFGHQEEGDFTCSATYQYVALDFDKYSCFCVVEKNLAEAGLTSTTVNTTASKPAGLAVGG